MDWQISLRSQGSSGDFTAGGAAWLCQLPFCTTPPHTHTDQSHHYLCVCVCVRPCVHTVCVYSLSSNCADICVSFVLLSLKPHNTCHLSQMAGCLPKMQMDDNKLYLQSKVTQLGAVNIGPSISCVAAGGRRHTHSYRQWHAKNEALTHRLTDRLTVSC